MFENKEKKSCISNLTVLITVIVFSVVNMGFTYFAVLQNEYRTYGWAENYEKVLLVNKAQYDSTLVKMSKSEIAEQIKKATGSEVAEQHPTASDTKLTKEDLVVKTPIEGVENAKYSIYDFTDLECPYCKQFHNSGLVKEVLAKDGQNVNHIIRNFPLESIHPGARLKAEASLCVAEVSWNEKYFEVVDTLFNKSTGHSKDSVLADLTAIWVDNAKLNECLTSGKYSETVNSDLTLWAKMWVTGTPSVYVVNNETGAFVKLSSRSVEAVEEAIKNI